MAGLRSQDLAQTLQRLQRAIGYVLTALFVVTSARRAIVRARHEARAPPAKPGGVTAKPGAASATPTPDPALGPMLVIETVKGTIYVQLFAKEAPKSVEQVVRLTKGKFYNQQKVHRVVAGQIVQFGDKQSRDATLREWWGQGPSSGSGKPIGVDGDVEDAQAQGRHGRRWRIPATCARPTARSTSRCGRCRSSTASTTSSAR